MTTASAPPDARPLLRTLDELPRLSLPGPLAASEFWLRPDKFADRCEPLGDRFTVRMPGIGTLLFLTHPDDVKAVFTASTAKLSLARAVRLFGPHYYLFGPTSMINVDGDAHLQKRRPLLPPFHGERLKAYQESMAAHTERLLDEIPAGRPIRFQDHMQRLTLEVIMTTVFGVTDANRTARLRAATMHMAQVIGSTRFKARLARESLRGGRWDCTLPYVDRAIQAVDEVVLEEVHERRASHDEDRGDVLSLLLQARYEDTPEGTGGDPLEDAEICSTMLGLLLGGHETTTASLAWLVERLVRTPAVLERLEESIDRGEREYLAATIKEALRVRPVVPLTARVATVPCTFGDVHVPPGTVVAPFITLVHRRPDVYPEPHEFRPERFLDAQPGTYSWIPFGGGPRRCIGGAFALFEMEIIMRALLSRFRLQPDGSKDEPIRREVGGGAGLSPGRGGRVRLVPLSAVA